MTQATIDGKDYDLSRYYGELMLGGRGRGYGPGHGMMGGGYGPGYGMMGGGYGPRLRHDGRRIRPRLRHEGTGSGQWNDGPAGLG